MRLHRLVLQAFGPFPDRTEVDLDTLSDAGLFLLSGPTGAGKSTVLDAVCFALFGGVPGDRGTANRLRCDSADPDVAPEVELEATLGGRRFRILRSPAWQRPKRRGGPGLTPVATRVSMSELRHGAWEPVSTRADEVGDQVGALLGMSLGQFTQVAMLPQGQFQRFLTARSEERHALLTRLFRTGRFEDVERWLAERRRHLSRLDEAEHQVVADVVSRASEAAGRPLPDGWDVRDLGRPADDGALTRWLVERRDVADHERVEAERQACELAAAEQEAAERLRRAREQAERRRRLVEARAERAALDARADAHADDVRRLDAARRAAPVVPLDAQAQALAAQEHDAEQRHVEAMTSLRSVLAQADAEAVDVVPDDADGLFVDLDAWDAASATLAARSVTLEALVPRAARLAALHRQVESEQVARATLDREQHDVAARLEALPPLVGDAEERVGAAHRASDRVVELDDRLVALRARREALVECDRISVRLDAARETWTAARETLVSRRETLLDVLQARIDGMAAELAGGLAVGCSCPVCGSAEHPGPARPATDAPDARAEKDAQVAVDDAASTEHARAEQVRDLEAGLAAARGRATAPGADEPPTLDDLDDEAAAVRAERDTARSRADGLREAERRLAALRAETTELEERRRRCDVAHAHSTSAQEAAEGEAAGIVQELAEALVSVEPEVLDALPSRAATLRRTHGAVTAVASAARAADAARDRAAQAVAQARRAATESGFATLADLRAARMAEPAVRALADDVAAHRDRLAAADAVLASLGTDEPVAHGDEQVGLDPEHCASAHRAAVDARTRAQASEQSAAGRHARLVELADRLAEALARWAPLRDDLTVTRRLAAFCDGTSPDNRLRMRLSAYVLAYRLSQVVAAANERLGAMTDRRYTLEHTDERARRERRGGLSLQVRDDWTGEAREPATLSGGETFVVSLALALGLADVISAEAGGAALDTLFVDEGFGSLDAETLDDVLDVLDGLRDGGRVVGVVSHVPEMRDRIPTQLVVSKSRQGSTIEVRQGG